MSAAILPMTPRVASHGTAGVRSIFHTASQVIAIGLGLAIPLTTSGAEILVGAYIVCWLLSGDILALPLTIRRNRVAAVCLAMFGVLLAGATYGPSNAYDVLKTLAKYRELLYAPLLFSAFAEERVRLWGLRAFLTGVVTMVGLSYSEWLFRFDIGLLSSTDYVLFKDRIVHSLLVAFAMYVIGHHAADERRFRWLRVAFLCLAVFNILVLVQGRTGHLVMSLLFLLFMFQRHKLRGVAVGIVLLGAFWGTVYKVSPAVRQRIQKSVSQLNDQIAQKRNEDARLEFYEYSVRIIRQNPILGTGTGGFLHAYREIARINGVPATEDPHSEYLLLAVQLGVFGPLAFLTLLTVAWLASHRLPITEHRIAQGLLMTIASGCVVNSLMYGFTGGLLFGYFAGLAFTALPDPATNRQASPINADPADSLPLAA